MKELGRPLTWQDVPGAGEFDFKDIYLEMFRKAPEGAVMVEVGTFFGRSALYAAEIVKTERPDLRFYVVDAWDEKWLAQPPLPPTQEAEMLEIAKHGSLFQTFAFYLEKSGLAPYVTVIRSDSAKAAGLFEGVRPYFVFIDGGHTFEQASADIDAWYSVQADGSGDIFVTGGHDYDHPEWPGVKQAVDSYFGKSVKVRGQSWLVNS